MTDFSQQHECPGSPSDSGTVTYSCTSSLVLRWLMFESLNKEVERLLKVGQ